MISTDLRSLRAKLNPASHAALEAAAVLCLSHSHYEVDIEHFLIKLLEVPNTDLDRILRHFEIDGSRLLADLVRAIEGFRTGNGRTPSLSPSIPAGPRPMPSERVWPTLLPEMSRELLARMAGGERLSEVMVSMGGAGGCL